MECVPNTLFCYDICFENHHDFCDGFYCLSFSAEYTREYQEHTKGVRGDN